MTKEQFIYDIYLLQSSGVPMFAGCTGTDYCKNHFEQHELHAGFFSALYMFSKETGVGTNLNSIFYEDIQINFKIDEDAEIILILVHPREVKEKKVQKNLETAYDIFIKNYYPKLDKDCIEASILDDYPHDLVEHGILHSEDLFPTKDLQMDTESFFKKWFRKGK